MDRFKINWIERNGKEEITCVSGFDLQVESWVRDYTKDAKKEESSVRRGTRIINSDGTITVTLIKTKNTKEK